MLMLVLNVLSTNATQEMILPAMHTARQPYLLANADTIGPVGRKFHKSSAGANQNQCQISFRIPFITYQHLSKHR